MRIVIASSFVPFVNGGARFIVEWLEQKLREHGHETERFYLPFVEHQDDLLDQMAAYRLMRLEDRCDLLVTFRPPSHLLRHPNKVVWFIHHIRGFYDLAGTEHQGFEESMSGRAVRDALFEIDTNALREARKLFTNSRIVANRVKRYNGLDAQPLYPPIFAPERFHHTGYGDEIVCICRVEPHKRQALLVDAMQYTRTAVKLRMCGRSANPESEADIGARIERSPARARIAFDNRWISEDEKAGIIAGALAVAYLPLDEDSYGYPTLEGAHACKPVLTTTDSGGVLEFAEDGRSGLVCEAVPEAIAAAMDRLYADRDATARLGRGAQARLSELRIDWEHVVRSIVS